MYFGCRLVAIEKIKRKIAYVAVKAGMEKAKLAWLAAPQPVRSITEVRRLHEEGGLLWRRVVAAAVAPDEDEAQEEAYLSPDSQSKVRNIMTGGGTAEDKSKELFVVLNDKEKVRQKQNTQTALSGNTRRRISRSRLFATMQYPILRCCSCSHRHRCLSGQELPSG